MNEEDLMKIAKKGEDSHSQFKSDVANPDSLAAEIVSLLNADGGTIYLGISDNGDISGLDGEDVRRLNLMISNVATQHIKNPVTVLTDNILLSNSKVVIAIKVPEGREKPYFDKNGIAWIKEGADKRDKDDENRNYAPHSLAPFFTPHPSAFGCHLPLKGKARYWHVFIVIHMVDSFIIIVYYLYDKCERGGRYICGLW